MDFNKIPKASEVITVLNDLIEKHGDLPICVDDPDTSWRLRMGIVYREKNISEGYQERFEIKTEFHGDPEDLIGESDEDR